MRAVALLTALLTRTEARRAARCIAADNAALRSAIEDLQSLKTKATDPRRPFRRVQRAVFKEDLRAILAEWRTASESNFLFRGSRQGKVRQALQPFATSLVPTDLGGSS